MFSRGGLFYVYWLPLVDKLALWRGATPRSLKCTAGRENGASGRTKLGRNDSTASVANRRLISFS